MTELVFKQIAAVACGQTCEEFTAQNPHPFVVAETAGTRGGLTFETTNDVNDVHKLVAAATARPVYPVKKSGRNKFGNVITLGRAANNDVIVSEPSVSKFHAYFNERLDSGGFELVDAGSTFGTKVKEFRLEPDQPHPLRSGDKITLGEAVLLTFYLPADLHSQLCRSRSLLGL